jgi:hypothetical protein
MRYVLIGTEASQFSGKARAYLRWNGVDFSERQATPEIYRDIIEPRIGFPVVPVLLTPGDLAIQDTADITDHIESVEKGRGAQPRGARVKRSLGTHEFAIGGRRGERGIITFSLWRLQRVLDHYRSLTGDTRVRADRLLSGIGAGSLSSFELPVRFDRGDYRLVTA